MWNKVKKYAFLCVVFSVFIAVFIYADSSDRGNKIIIYGNNSCRICKQFKKQMDLYAIPYQYINLSEDESKKEELKKLVLKDNPELKNILLPVVLVKKTVYIRPDFEEIKNIYFGKTKSIGRKTGDEEARTRLVRLFYKYYKADYVSPESLYNKMPNIKAKSIGRLKSSERKNALRLLNIIRKLHDLKPLSYYKKDQKYTNASVLVMAANNVMTHYPKRSFIYYSDNAAKGSKTSNLFFGSYYSKTFSTEFYINGWVVDEGVRSLGHRRWFLNPFLKYFTYSRVDGSSLRTSKKVSAAATKVMDYPSLHNYSDQKLDFVAYPYKIYPQKLFKNDWFLSFSVIVNRSNLWENAKNNINYSNAKIEVRNSNGKKLRVFDISSNYQGYGVPNLIQWRVDGLKSEEVYWVTIKNVSVYGTNRTYNYYFELVERGK